MTAKTKMASASLAGAFASALALVASQASAAPVAPQPDKDKCYGVSLKGHNDCAAGAGTTCAGTQSVDYDGGHWKYVARGTCDTIKTPDGIGSLAPFKS
jgi:uncharacterized membrane protein